MQTLFSAIPLRRTLHYNFKFFLNISNNFENLLNLQETKFFPRQNLNLIICIIHFTSEVTVRWLVIFSNKWLLHFFYLFKLAGTFSPAPGDDQCNPDRTSPVGSGVPESPESPSHQHWDTDATSDHHCPTPAAAPHPPNPPTVCTSSSVSQNYKYTCTCV